MFYFDEHPQYFELQKKVSFYIQKNLNTEAFEKAYIDIRNKEEQIFCDEQVQDLPHIYLDHPWYHEWKVRERSATKLVGRLKKEKPKVILEVGCGNGWLVNVIQRNVKVPTVGVDINKFELQQAGSIHWGWAHFAYGDVLSEAFDDFRADAIILAASVQYFPDLRALLTRLRYLLNENGTIHILDTPFYKKEKVADARARSADYFNSKEAGGMEKFYFHHDIDILKEFNPTFLYRPNIFTRLLNKYNSPFPWVRIRKR
jgi:SAM-dependent methyltransferase